MASETDETRLADELDPIYDVIHDAREEVTSEEEREALERIVAATDYARDLALQREFPTPNQQLYHQVSGETIEKPDHPGDWEEFRDSWTDENGLLEAEA